MLPALVVSISDCPDSENCPPLAWKVGLALPPMVKLPEEFKAKTTFVCPAMAEVIGKSPCNVSALLAKATVATCCLGVSSGVFPTVTPNHKEEFCENKEDINPQEPVAGVAGALSPLQVAAAPPAPSPPRSTLKIPS